MKFDDIINTKLGQLNEQVPVATPGTVQAPTNTAGTAQQPQTNQSTPEQELIKIFQALPYQANPQAAVATFNTALKNAGNVPGINQFYSNLGFDPKRGFVYIQPQQAGQQTTKPEAGQQTATTPGAAAPGATATNVSAGTSVGNVNP